jgi:hypothetical protein
VHQSKRFYEVIQSGIRSVLRDDRAIGNVAVQGATTSIEEIVYSNDLKITMPLISRRNDPESVNVFSAVACGIVVTDVPLHVQQNNLHNQRIALTNRVGAPVPVPDQDEQRQFSAFLEREHDAIFGEHEYIAAIKDDDNSRFERWLVRFNASQQKILRDARLERVLWGLPDERILYAHDLFNKVEKAGKDAKPRPIQAASPALNEVMGPEAHALSLHLRAVWNARNFLTYAPGCSATELGDKFNRSKDLRGVEADNKMHDTTMRDFQHLVICEVLRRVGCSKAFIKHYWKNRKTYGHSKLGISYSAGARVKSGDQTTTVANTLYVILSRLYVFCRDNNRSVRDAKLAGFSIMGAGDDSFQFQPWSAVVPDGARERRLGTMPEFANLESIDMGTFCSNVFYPVTVGNEETYALAPMAGRVIPRLGWFVNCPSGPPAAFARGAALGLQRDTRFIPYLREYIAAILRVTKSVTARHSDKDKRNWDNIFHVGADVRIDGRMADWWQRRYGQDYTQSVQPFLKQLDNVTQLPYAISKDHIAHIVSRDYPDSDLS